MGIRLLILDLWTPNFVIRKELDDIFGKTTAALQALISEYAKEKIEVKDQKQQPPKAIKELRAIMAQTQATMVETLEATLGREEALRLGRKALFSVGKNLGMQARSRLGVGDSKSDLVTAAKVLYRVLGIRFHLDWIDNSNAVAIIDRCALSEKYSELTCEVLSATDEGVMQGLQPNVSMRFKQYMTSGCKNCKASIRFNQKRNV